MDTKKINWIEKYKPQTVSEILGDINVINKIDKFIKQFLKEKFNPNKINNPNLIITGTNGIGKTLIIDLIIKENGLEKAIIDLTNITVAKKSKKKKKISNLNNTVLSFYLSLKNNKKLLINGEYEIKRTVIVFDNVTDILNCKEKDIIREIIKINNKYKEIPIVIISNTKHNKIINDLRKNATYTIKKDLDGKKQNIRIINEISLKAPEYNDMEKLIKKICIKENLKLISSTDDINTEIINHAQYDIRRLINTLEELKLIYGRSNITIPKFNDYCYISKKKDLDPGIHEATKILLNDYTTIENSLLIYSEDRATIPLMVHKNYPINIKKQYPKISKKEQINMIQKISNSISESDKIDGLIYSNQCWSLQTVHGFYSCTLPSYYVNELSGKLCNVEKYKYTQDYNKTSIKKINNKVIKKAQENELLKKVSIYDFLYIASILKTLIERKDFVGVVELMKPYKLTLKEIESIIKIDKIKLDDKKVKAILTAKERNNLKNLLGVTE